MWARISASSGSPDGPADVLERYLKWDYHRVAGYASDLDLRIFAGILGWQTRTGKRGSLGEIGVHHGRSFLPLAFCRASGEKLLAADLFEDDDINASDAQHSQRGPRFFAHLARYRIQLTPDEVYRGSSVDLSPELLRREFQPFRFFSIDGGHTYDFVASDLATASAVLGEAGVIAVDDWMNPAWPDVSIAVGDALRQDVPELAPFLSTDQKLYLCAVDSVELLQRTLRESVLPTVGQTTTRTAQVLGAPVIHVSVPLRRRVGTTVRRRLVAG